MFTVVMPMAGKGSRFKQMGYDNPKPLIDFKGKPFFWWATESILRSTKSKVELIYVILEEHVIDFSLDKIIHSFFPEASIKIIPGMTSGSLETAMIGVYEANQKMPILVNDCDHYFEVKKLDAYIEMLQSGLIDGFLCNFESNLDCYSYARYDKLGALEQTVEKIVISPQAIAGVYGFRSPGLIISFYDSYRRECPYDELFISGIFNLIVRSGGLVNGLNLDRHLSFGTPNELVSANKTIESWR